MFACRPSWFEEDTGGRHGGFRTHADVKRD
jgi:hypothetical protein